MTEPRIPSSWAGQAGMFCRADDPEVDTDHQHAHRQRKTRDRRGPRDVGPRVRYACEPTGEGRSPRPDHIQAPRLEPNDSRCAGIDRDVTSTQTVLCSWRHA
jgi:hypothetical protein